MFRSSHLRLVFPGCAPGVDKPACTPGEAPNYGAIKMPLPVRHTGDAAHELLVGSPRGPAAPGSTARNRG